MDFVLIICKFSQSVRDHQFRRALVFHDGPFRELFSDQKQGHGRICSGIHDGHSSAIISLGHEVSHKILQTYFRGGGFKLCPAVLSGNQIFAVGIKAYLHLLQAAFHGQFKLTESVPFPILSLDSGYLQEFRDR